MKQSSQIARSALQRPAGVPPPLRGTYNPKSRSTPHWEKDGATYFITFRLADSLPKSVLDRIESERQAIVSTANQLHRRLSTHERRKLQSSSTPTIEQYLDTGVALAR